MKGNQMLEKLLSKSALCLKRNSSTILTVIGAVGVAATAITAVKATPKALRLLDKATYEKGEDLTKLEVVKVAAPAYIPSAVIGVSTIACIFGANVLNKRHQAALTSAYALADGMYKEYSGKVKELFGEEADIQVREAIAKDKAKEIDVYVPGMNSLDLSGEKRLFYEEYRGKYFESTIEAVQNAEYHFNRNFTMRGFACLNEFYEFLGLEPTNAGSELGWDACELLEAGLTPWIDFDHRIFEFDDGLECCIITMPIPPTVPQDED